jgi:hypothetical protein
MRIWRRWLIAAAWLLLAGLALGWRYQELPMREPAVNL